MIKHVSKKTNRSVVVWANLITLYNFALIFAIVIYAIITAVSLVTKYKVSLKINRLTIVFI